MNKRSTLKQLLSGQLSPQEAAANLQTDAGINNVALAIKTAKGLYNVGSETGLTYEEMKARLAGKPFVEIDEDDSLLGSGPPDLMAGTNGTVYIFPCNNR